MKSYIIIFLFAVIFYGCDKPAPTELVEDQDQLDVAVIAKDLDDEFYSNGFDSTGVAENPTRFTNLITISGIKITTAASTERTSFAQAIFFDRNFPIRRNGVLIGFRTRVLGMVRFNNIAAKLVPFISTDTTLGFKYILNGGRRPHHDPFSFDFGSLVKFEFNL